jgi:hypothetical protein
VKTDLEPAKTEFKNLRVATALALLFGGPAGFYFGIRRGLETTFAWLYFLFVLTGARYWVTTVTCLALVQFAFAAITYRYCSRRNAARATNLRGEIPEGNQRVRRRWLEVLAYCGKIALVLVLGICLFATTYFVDLLATARRFENLGKSLTVGMTIEDVVHRVQEPGLIYIIPSPNDRNEIEGLTLYGPEKGIYHSIPGGQSLEAKEAASALERHTLPGQEYRLVFTFTPFYGPHWSLTVQFDTENKVKGVLPVRAWD